MKLLKLNLIPVLIFIFPMTVREQHPSHTVKGNSQFAFELYKKLAAEKQNTNVFFSPFSISSALAMTYAGARNETQQAMSSTLHFVNDQDTLHADFDSLLSKLKLNQTGIQLNLVNALFAQKDYHFEEAYFELVKSKYDAGIEYVNFREKAAREKARLQINSWVEDKTNRKIKEMLRPEILTEDAKLVLVNAIYFLGKWEIPFDKKLTKEGTFYAMPKGNVKIPFMNIKMPLRYHESEKVQTIEIPYKEHKLALVLMLPKDKAGIKDLGSSISYDKYMDIMNSMSKETVELSMPKFKTTAEFNLEKNLSDLGMSVAFTDKADFSGMTGEKNLHIDKVIHKAFIELSEEGTEAAGATAVVMQRSGAPKKNKIVKADHPFLFFIKDNETESILFMGKILHPSAK